MRQTRKINISEKVFTLDDLRRVAKIFVRQRDLARKSDHHAETEYEIDFSDETSIRSDDTDLISDDFVVGPSRPIQVRFSFRNYTLNRRLDFTVNHGEFSFGNTAMVSGDEQAWVSESFLALKDSIDTVRPQSFWFRRHQSLLLHLIALGIGSLVQLSIELLVTALILRTELKQAIKPLDPNSPWLALLGSLRPVLYVVLWAWRWVLGLLWGAPAVRTWLLSLWPKIEFDFGAKHLNIEKEQRARLAAVVSLIVIPIAASIIYDVIKLAF